MFVLLTLVAIVVSVLLGAIVLIQNPKGGGLTSNFSSSSQLMGVQRTGDFLEKGTWILAITLMVISLAMNVGSKTSSGDNGKAEQMKINKEASKPGQGGATQQQQPLNLGGAGTTAPTGAAPQTPAPKGK
jgi:preprotein translocase subunit SecG